MSTAPDIDQASDQAIDLSDRQSYAHWTADVVRFADLDPLAHVNNVAFSTYFESGRVRFFRDADSAVNSPDYAWMAVRLCIDFKAQIGYPGTVDIGTRILRIGRSSITLGAGLFANDGCVANAECVMVLVDAQTNRPTETPLEMRRSLLTQNPDQSLM
jgi:acyl-CoA thioester hydrolase